MAQPALEPVPRQFHEVVHSQMARGRMISRTLSTSEKRAALYEVVPDLVEFCQQLFPLLVVHADDFGRQPGDVFTVKHAIDPISRRGREDFERGLTALHTVNLIERYQVDGRWFIQIVKFDEHQVGLHKRTRSKFPPPPEVSGKTPETTEPPKSLEKTATSGNAETFPEIPSEGKGREENRTEGKGTAPSAPPPRPLRPASIIQPRRGNAAFEGPRGLYVPQKLHNQFVQLRHHPAAESELLAWYGTVCEEWETGARKDENPDPDMFRFWNARFAEKWPPSKPGAAAPPSGPDPAIQRNREKYGPKAASR